MLFSAAVAVRCHLLAPWKGGIAITLPAELSEAEETRRRLASYEMVLEQERRSAKQSLVIVLIVLTIDITVFLIHWSLARRARGGLAGVA